MILAEGRRRWTMGLVLFGLLQASGCHGLSYYENDCQDERSCPGNTCEGQCAPLPPLDFEGPALVWIGPESQSPGCPTRAPQRVYQGWAELDGSYECPPCACSEPRCLLPDGVVASNTNACQGPQLTPVESPPGWTGACVAAEPLVPSQDLRSLSIAPVTASACAPLPQPVPQGPGPVGWGLIALACRGEAVDELCNDPGTSCLPTPDPGFRQCILYQRDGEPTCPATYPERFRFHGDVADTRACTECTCTETAPPSCTALLSTYQDPACTQPLVSLSLGLGGMPTCNDIGNPNATLGSLSASWMTNEPGTCVASGGLPTGEAVPIEPRHFCCQPLPEG